MNASFSFASAASFLGDSAQWALAGVVIVSLMLVGAYKIYSWMGSGGDSRRRGGAHPDSVCKCREMECRRNSFRPFSFDGRIGRLQFFLTLFGVYALWLLILIAEHRYLPEEYGGLYARLMVGVIYVSFYVCIAQGVKRCHDIGRTGQFLVVPFHVLVRLAKRGVGTDNEYGAMTSGAGGSHRDWCAVAASMTMVTLLQCYFSFCC